MNLRKAKYVATFKNLYPNITKILIEQYGLNLDEKIVVFWTKEISLPHFNRYRLKFRKVFSGKVLDFVPILSLIHQKEYIRFKG